MREEKGWHVQKKVMVRIIMAGIAPSSTTSKVMKGQSIDMNVIITASILTLTLIDNAGPSIAANHTPCDYK